MAHRAGFHQGVRLQRASETRVVGPAHHGHTAAAAPTAMASLQQSIGNRAVARLVHARLEVAWSGDRFGREVDPAMSVDSGRTESSAADGVQGNREPCPASIERDRLALAENGVGGVGQPLPAGPRALFEGQFGTRFADVRLHAGPRAAAAARQLGAAAYTLGPDIAFGNGFYTPKTRGGLRLLAHELTHVVQSRGAPASPLPAGEATASLGPLEAEAERASDAFGRGPMVVQEQLGGRMPLCHPVYISAHGKKPYLERAADFHRLWGNAPLKTGIPSIEAILRDLAGKSSIGQVTIVSHADPDLIQMQFVDGGPAQVLKSDWDIDTVAELVTLEFHLPTKDMLDTVIGYVQTAKPDVLPRIGPVSDPIVRQFIWWVVDQVAAEYGLPGGQAVRAVPAARAHTAAYRSRLLSPPTQPAGAGSVQPAVSASALDDAEKAVREQALRWPWPKPGEAARFDLTPAGERRFSESPAARIIQKPDFFDDLTLVRGLISDSSWIEIQGCNAGRDVGYLEAIQRFFGGSTKKPKVTAPDMFQSFGHYGYTSIGEDEVPSQWIDKDVQAALAYWYPIIVRGKKLPKKPTELTLLEYLRQGHALPLAIPGGLGTARVLLLNTQGRKAFLEWLSRHSYQLTQKEIEQKMFGGKDFGANVENAVVDMLKGRMGEGPMKIIFRPSPEYQQHIIEVH
jgi:hypothetical protein